MSQYMELVEDFDISFAKMAANITKYYGKTLRLGVRV